MKKILLTIYLLLVTLVTFAQTRQLSGIVQTAEKSEVLTGVVIHVKGSSAGTVTDIDGKFVIDIPDDDKTILVLNYIGYQQNEFAVGAQKNVIIQMTSSSKSLNEVVVVGYGSQKRKDITGAVSSFKATNLDERPVGRIDDALLGELAGVDVKQTSGAPGKPMSIQVRGTGSISAGSEPLYVIDGFPLNTAQPNGSGSFASGNPLDNMNPNDIESIQVLKDAAAAAIYGSRASNGVVLITTKKGKVGKNQITLNMYTGTTQASKKLDMMSPEQWINRATEIINAQWVASGTGRTASQTSDQRRSILGLQPGQVNTQYMLDDRWAQPGHPGLAFLNLQDQAFRTAVLQNYQVTSSGGTDLAKYYISANYQDEPGFVLGMDYKSYSARANVDVNASKKLKVGLNIAPSYSIKEDPGVEGKDNILHHLISMTPVQEASAGANANSGSYGQYAWGNSWNSPIQQLLNNVGESKTFRTLTSGYADYAILNDLHFRTTVNFDNASNESKFYSPYTVNGTLLSRTTQPGLNTIGSYTGYTNQTFVNENTLTYTKSFKDVHNISAVVGESYNFYKIDNVALASSGGYGANITTLNGANGIAGTGGTTANAGGSVNGSTNSYTYESQSVLLSYLGRVQYDYMGKYLISASIRRDGSSRFGADTKFGWFPSTSLGWRLSDEKFMKPLKFINDMKLRGSWGKSGNNNIGDYSSYVGLGFANYTFGGAQATGQGPVNVANPNIGWEKSQTFNYGTDITLANNRIIIAFDYYSKRNTDLLLNVPIPQVTGFASALTNVGEVLNQGWEGEITTRNIVQKNFQWTTSFNIAHNTNKVVSLGAGQNSLQIPSLFDVPHSILQVGQPMYSIYVVRNIGVLTQADINNHVALYGNETVGDPKYYDANHDGKIDANDRVIVGHPTPDIIFGFTNTVKFKGFDLSILVQGQMGGSIYSLLGRAINRTGQSYTDPTLAEYDDRYRSPSSPGNGVNSKAYSTFGRIVNTDWLYSSDYISIRSITLGYDLMRIIKINHVNGARVYASAENFFSWDKYKGGYNPDAANTNLGSNSSFPEAGDYGGLPLPKKLIFGVNFIF
ncbi:MAG: TonB-dependent receptor [Flavipsychrobacter sp.]|nr:TonB-dependent receptor [Flavipsychrobacter sp.]